MCDCFFFLPFSGQRTLYVCEMNNPTAVYRLAVGLQDKTQMFLVFINLFSGRKDLPIIFLFHRFNKLNAFYVQKMQRKIWTCEKKNENVVLMDFGVMQYTIDATTRIWCPRPCVFVVGRQRHSIHFTTNI